MAPAAGPLPPEATPQYMTYAGWQKQSQTLDALMASIDLSRIRLLFVGDSITANWQQVPLFQQFYGTRNPLNLGLAGDSIQGVLWRLDHSPLGAALKPQLAVVLIGTNNLWVGQDPAHVALGIAEVMRMIQRKSPTTRVLLLGLLPRGAQPDDPLRQMVARVNQLIIPCADGDRVQYAHPGDMLADGAGVISNQILFDYLHPTWLGYAILAAGMEPSISQMMGPR